MVECPKINGLKQADMGRLGPVKVLDSASSHPLYYTSLVLNAISICLEPIFQAEWLGTIDWI